jgi:hypothetical protein
VSPGKVLSCGERIPERFIRRGEVPQGCADSALRYRFCSRFCIFGRVRMRSYAMESARDGPRPLQKGSDCGVGNAGNWVARV